jgi:regulator of sirC expression with transglutaminase-like and TPR domain
MVVLAASALAWILLRSAHVKATIGVESTSFKQPKTFNELQALSSTELEDFDIARMNLLCAKGLPGAEDLRMNDDLAKLDVWAQHIKSEIDRNIHHYWNDPALFYNSTNFYKMAMMARVLYEDYNIRYDPSRIFTPGSERPDDHFFADPDVVFIHGLIGDKHMGTCSSMPVLYIALGRRLGYPLKLVTTKQHLFVRWDSPTETFDMDATGKGVSHSDDSVYRQWPFPISDEEIKAEGYLKSLSPQEELSVFMSIRGMCQLDNGRLTDAAESFKSAYRLQPAWRDNQILSARAQQIQNPMRNP